MKSELIENARSGSYFPRQVTLLAGTDNPTAEVLEPFSPEAIAFLDDFSKTLRRDRRARQDAEVMALAFWCRRAHLIALKNRHGLAPGRMGRGKIFHLAPANVPMMFVYTWAIGLLAGNAGIVRISERTLRREAVQDVLRVFRELFSQEENAAVRERTSLISYARSDEVTEQILAGCRGRVLWGGDETIRHMQQIPMPENAVELTFPDRVSLAVISGEALEKADQDTLLNLVHRFYNDTYVMDQNGCSSPQTVIWLKKTEEFNQASCPGISRVTLLSQNPVQRRSVTNGGACWRRRRSGSMGWTASARRASWKRRLCRLCRPMKQSPSAVTAAMSCMCCGWLLFRRTSLSIRADSDSFLRQKRRTLNRFSAAFRPASRQLSASDSIPRSRQPLPRSRRRPVPCALWKRDRPCRWIQSGMELI